MNFNPCSISIDFRLWVTQMYLLFSLLGISTLMLDVLPSLCCEFMLSDECKFLDRTN